MFFPSCFLAAQVKCSSPGTLDASPPFGSNAAWSACDGTVYMRQVGVVPCVVPGTNLKAKAATLAFKSYFKLYPF